jgi:hypothetical protein
MSLLRTIVKKWLARWCRRRPQARGPMRLLDAFDDSGDSHWRPLNFEALGGYGAGGWSEPVTRSHRWRPGVTS